MERIQQNNIVICEDINFDNDLMNSFPLRPAEEVAPASDLSNPNRWLIILFS